MRRDKIAKNRSGYLHLKIVIKFPAYLLFASRSTLAANSHLGLQLLQFLRIHDINLCRSRGNGSAAKQARERETLKASSDGIEPRSSAPTSRARNEACVTLCYATTTGDDNKHVLTRLHQEARENGSIRFASADLRQNRIDFRFS